MTEGGLDSSLAKQVLGWQPLLDTEQAVGWTVAWELAIRKGASPQKTTFEQIQRLTTDKESTHVQ